jgi:hypothetical protein
MSPRKLLPIFALAGLLAAGCAEENLLAPGGSEDTTPPAAPQGAILQPSSGDWRMSWNPNGEADLAGYNVFRYDPDPSRENAYVKVNPSTITTNSYSVSVDPASAIFRVRAVDATGNQSGMSGIATLVAAGSGRGGDGGDEIRIAR